MVTSWEIKLAIIIVSLWIVMAIYYSYQRKKNLKIKNKPSDGNKIKNYIHKINEINLKKQKWKKVCQSVVSVEMILLY